MTANLESNVDIRKSAGWVIALSIILILLGILSILAPGFASVFFISFMGWIALISGIVMIVQLFVSKPVRGFWLNLIVGIFYAIAGVYPRAISANIQAIVNADQFSLFTLAI